MAADYRGRVGSEPRWNFGAGVAAADLRAAVEIASGSDCDGLALGRHRAGPPARVDRDVGEGALGHQHPLVAEMAPHPAFDLDGDRAAADSRHLGVAAHLIADE